MKKICRKCNIDKNLDCFRVDVRYYLGVKGQCRECENNQKKLNYALLPQEVRLKRQKIQSKRNEKSKKEYYKKNKERIKKNVLKRQKDNPEKYKKYWREYWSIEKNKKRKYSSYKEKIKNDPHFRFVNMARQYVRDSLNRRKIRKCDKFINLLGCSVDALKQYIESQFKSGMTWENYGYYGWHIDHIKPCASFDLSKEEEQRKCFHFSNLQPLWATENLKKGSKIL